MTALHSVCRQTRSGRRRRAAGGPRRLCTSAAYCTLTRQAFDSGRHVRFRITGLPFRLLYRPNMNITTERLQELPRRCRRKPTGEIATCAVERQSRRLRRGRDGPLAVNALARPQDVQDVQEEVTRASARNGPAREEKSEEFHLHVLQRTRCAASPQPAAPGCTDQLREGENEGPYSADHDPWSCTVRIVRTVHRTGGVGELAWQHASGGLGTPHALTGSIPS